MDERTWTACLPKPLADEILKERAALRELRLRAERPAQLAGQNLNRFFGAPIHADELRSICLTMMEHSYYAREEELTQGYFTLRDGCRAGVCGAFSVRDGRVTALRAVGSLCIRIAREVRGCALQVVERLVSPCGVESALIVSAPGFGKTTILRDATRLLSERGFSVGVADERHELAACRNGVPTLDIGPRTDVADGCPRTQALELLLRSMSPQVLATDEIGNAADVQAVSRALCRGTAVLATAHAGSLDELEQGVLQPLLNGNGFRLAFLLGESPGKILEIRRYPKGGRPCESNSSPPSQ